MNVQRAPGAQTLTQRETEEWDELVSKTGPVLCPCVCSRVSSEPKKAKLRIEQFRKTPPPRVYNIGVSSTSPLLDSDCSQSPGRISRVLLSTRTPLRIRFRLSR